MKLKTPYFNPTVLKKDITRFAPVWALYTIFLLIYVILGSFLTFDSLWARIVISAMILLTIFFVEFVANKYFSGFLFKTMPDGYYELLNIVTIAKIILSSALARTESVGAHYRED